jgi:hypothetical protein
VPHPASLFFSSSSSSFFIFLFFVCWGLVFFFCSDLFSISRFQWDKHPRLIIEAFVLLLSPYAPHMAEELWLRLGHSTSLTYEPLPKVLFCIFFKLFGIFSCLSI